MKKNDHFIDDFFRNVLENHTVAPSTQAKEAFLKEAADIPSGTKTGRRRMLFLLGGIILIMISTGLYLTFHPTQNKIQATNKTKNEKGIAKSEERKMKNEIAPVKSEERKTKTEISSVKSEERKTKSNNAIVKSGEGKVKNEIAAVKSEEGKVKSEERKVNNDEKVAGGGKEEETMKPEEQSPVVVAEEKNITEPVAAAKTETKPQTDVPKGKEDQKEKGKTKKNASRINLSGDVYYTPEWMFNTLEGEKFVNSFGAEGTIRLGNYSIRTGAGLSITKGTNEMSVGYNDYLGSYAKLDSMSFSWNDQHSKLVPQYFLSNADVYDSLVKLGYANVVKRYTYLQVPLILGYDFPHSGKFGFGLRTGPILSILLDTKQVSGTYDAGENRIVYINQISPERIATNWQIMGGISLFYTISDHLGIELEPQARYYFNSVYEQADVMKKPWSVGIRLAFRFY
jgi:hypothetical protein